MRIFQPMRDPKKHTPAVLATILLALLLLIYLENFVVPADWTRTHDTIHALIVLTCLQPLLLWRQRQWQEERERKRANQDTTRVG
jgi:hypothetical protein